MQLLLEARADIASVRAGSVTPVGLAARRGYLKIVQLLLEARADKDKVDTSEGLTLSRTSIWLASWIGHVDVVRLLLEWGADKDKACSPGHSTPLEVACKKGHKPIINLLKAAGAHKAPDS